MKTGLIKWILIFCEEHIFSHIPDEQWLKIEYRIRVRKHLNLENPKTFNEKIQWLKIHDRQPQYTMLADKYLVKKYVSQKLGEQYVIPTLGVWDSFEKIDFDNLPKQFVLKCNHDSGGVYICEDKEKLNVTKLRHVFTKELKRDYYLHGRQWVYHDIKRKIIAEKYLLEDICEAGFINEILDYKFMCFNGKCKYIFTCSERYSDDGLKVTFFDTKWNMLPFERHYARSKKCIEPPQNLNKMIRMAEILAEGIKFIRVDFYEINREKIYFGEMTFYPGNGMEEFRPDWWDYELGKQLEI